jgi:hypothetical protein
MISCNGKDPHLFCMNCPKQYIETEIGQGKCRPVCFASTVCKGTFSRSQLQQVLDQKTFDRLEHLQQQQDLAAAGLDFLSECPFCDYKQECPPIKVDKEFRCQNTKCGKTSCRLCNKETHIPLSCEEAKKDNKITMRHFVEEAMTAALIRKCNRCRQPFIKESGCNKMSCTNCGNKQWYVHSRHFTRYVLLTDHAATFARRTLATTNISATRIRVDARSMITSRMFTSKLSSERLTKPWQKSRLRIPSFQKRISWSRSLTVSSRPKLRVKGKLRND